MNEIIQGGAATIFVSHALGQVRDLCNKILWLHRGQQIMYGNNAAEICNLYQRFLDGEISIKDVLGKYSDSVE